jgi:hypothetical protein
MTFTDRAAEKIRALLAGANEGAMIHLLLVAAAALALINILLSGRRSV